MKKYLYAMCALSFALPWLSAAFAEPVKIGFISPAAPPALAAMSDVLSGQLATRGLVRDRDFTFELRAAEGKPERLPALAKGLMDAHVAAILASSYPAARAAKGAKDWRDACGRATRSPSYPAGGAGRDVTSTVPIVILGAGEPVETGFA